MKLLTAEQIAKISQKVDDVIKVKGLLEAVDGPAVKFTLNMAVNAIEKKGLVPDEVCMAVQNATDLIIGGAYAEAIGQLEPIADKYIDFKKLDDDTEAALFGVVFFLLKTVVGYFQGE